VSVLLHFFFTAVFMFMFLEALHTYSLVAFVVKKNGLFSRRQNVIIGWGIPLGIVLISMGLFLDEYGGKYHCWLQMDKDLMMAQIIPMVVLVILIFTMIEAAGAAEYRR
jgi:cytochrome bd-type quinol oxidase subunit 1